MFFSIFRSNYLSYLLKPLGSAMVFSLVLTLLTACGGGGGAGSGSEAQNSTGSRDVAKDGTPANRNLPGMIHYGSPYYISSIDLASGMEYSLRSKGDVLWAAKNAEYFTDGYSLDTDSSHVDVFGKNGFDLFGVEVQGNLFGQPKISPNGRYLVIGVDDHDIFRGFKIYNQEGELIRQFSQPYDTSPYYNSAAWMSDGSLIIVRGNTFYKLATPISSGDLQVISTVDGLNPFHITVSPNDQNIAFDGQVYDEMTEEYRRHIFVMNIDGGELRQVTTSLEQERDPTWSPNGEYLAFRHSENWLACVGSSCVGQCPKILAIPADASMVRIHEFEPDEPAFLIKVDDGYSSSSVCSFDELEWTESLEFSPSKGGTAISGVGVNAGLEGKLIFGELISNPKYVDVKSGETYAIDDVNGRYPHQAYGGDIFVFEQDTPGSGNYDLDRIVLRNDSGDLVSSFWIAQDYNASVAMISPFGNYIAAEWSPLELDGGGVNVVTLFTPDGTYLDQRFKGYGDYDWFPDEKLLLERLGRIERYSPESDELEFLSQLPQNVSDVALSPNGQKMAFEMLGHIWLSNLDGSNLTQLTTSAESEDNPSWSPDGKYIAFRYDDSYIYALPADAARVYVGGAPSENSTLHRMLDSGSSGLFFHYSFYWR